MLVSGIDFSERSIRYAKQVADHKRLDISYFRHNYLEFEENGFKVEEFYSDIAGAAISSESPDIAIAAKESNDT